MNEGKFPAGRSQNSLIPYDVKREFRFCLLSKKCHLYLSFSSFAAAHKNIYLLYNTESGGLDAGERQTVEKTGQSYADSWFFNAVLSETAYQAIVIPNRTV
jgi:hypothetical protein